MKPRKSLREILDGDKLKSFTEALARTKPAEDLRALPAGNYTAHIIEFDLFNSRSNTTPGVKLTFKVCEGEYTGRLFWYDIWLTPAAAAMAGRDFEKLGIKSVEQFDQPLPGLIRCRCKLTLRRSDEGDEFNKLKHFDVIGVDEFERDPFAPNDADADVDTSFDIDQLEGELRSDGDSEAA